MHQVDIIEDVAIAYGYNNIEPTWRELPTTGRAKPDQRYIDIARELMVGLGYQETLNTTLTNQETLFQKMNMPTNQNHRTLQPQNRDHDLPAQLAPAKPHGVPQQQPISGVSAKNL